MEPLEIPTFSGKFEEWPAFQDLFKSMVYSNASIVEVQTFVYLRMYLARDKLKLCRNCLKNNHTDMCIKKNMF